MISDHPWAVEWLGKYATDWSDYAHTIHNYVLSVKPKFSLELGTGGLTSTIAILTALESIRLSEPSFDYKFVTVDNFDYGVDREMRGKSTAEGISRLNSHLDRERVFFIETDANNFGTDEVIDFLYLDDGHWPDDLYKEMVNLAPRVRVGGLILIDDTNSSATSEMVGVRRYLDASAEKFELTEFPKYHHNPQEDGSARIINSENWQGMTLLRRLS